MVTADGTGYVEVAPAFVGESGAFTLSLTVTDPPTLDAVAPALIRLGGSRGIGAVMFPGTAGATAQVTIRGVGGETDGATIAIYQDGVQLVDDDNFEGGAAGILYQLDMASASPVYVLITADTTFDEADAGTFEVSLSIG